MLPQVQPAVAAMHAQANAAPPKTQRSTLLRSSHNSAFVHCVDAPHRGIIFLPAVSLPARFRPQKISAFPKFLPFDPTPQKNFKKF